MKRVSLWQPVSMAEGRQQRAAAVQANLTMSLYNKPSRESTQEYGSSAGCPPKRPRLHLVPSDAAQQDQGQCSAPAGSDSPEDSDDGLGHANGEGGGGSDGGAPLDLAEGTRTIHAQAAAAAVAPHTLPAAGMASGAAAGHGSVLQRQQKQQELAAEVRACLQTAKGHVLNAKLLLKAKCMEGLRVEYRKVS